MKEGKNKHQQKGRCRKASRNSVKTQYKHEHQRQQQIQTN